jgi:FkbM family methyltransferase
VQSVDPEEDEIRKNLRALSNSHRLPQTHIDYLKGMNDGGFKPKVIYDIGACVLHWTNSAKTVWPNARYIVFEAMSETQFLYEEQGLGYVCGSPLYHTDNVDLEFYENLIHPAGNSIYQENEVLSPAAAYLYSNNNKVIKKSATLDTLVKHFNFELPDLIKMDVQGAELDVLRGAQNTLKNCNHLILELQEEDYNKNAPKLNEVEQYLNSIGFVNKSGKFSECSQFDGDYHFVRD